MKGPGGDRRVAGPPNAAEGRRPPKGPTRRDWWVIVASLAAVAIIVPTAIGVFLQHQANQETQTQNQHDRALDKLDRLEERLSSKERDVATWDHYVRETGDAPERYNRTDVVYHLGGARNVTDEGWAAWNQDDYDTSEARVLEANEHLDQIPPAPSVEGDAALPGFIWLVFIGVFLFAIGAFAVFEKRK